MNNIETIFRLLRNSGFHVLGSDGTYIHLEDPSCILRSFETFTEYAWIAITVITGILIFGWGISMIRGAKNDLFTNMRNLILIFGILTAAKPIVNLIWGGDVFARGCKTINVSIAEVQKILDARNLKLAERDEFDLYEIWDITDSGATPYSDLPVYGAGDLQSIPVTVTDGSPGLAGLPILPTNESQATPTPQATQPTRTPSRPTLSPTFASGGASLANESGNSIIYTFPDGTKIRKIGGSRAWRNNNPGNIIKSKFATSQGAIGTGGRFAVFPDEATGMNAIKALLRTKSYASLTMGAAISRYAPPHENDTASYQRKLEKMTGISINTPMNQLDENQMTRVAEAIRTIEGWKPGREEKL